VSAGYPYQIDVYDEEGRFARRVTRAFRARPVTDSDVSEYLSRLNQAGPRRVSESRLRSVRANAALNRAEYFGATRALIASKEGSIWIERPDTKFDLGDDASIPGFEPGPRYWDTFDAEGRYQFTVRLPDRFTARWIGEHSVAGVQRDANDVEYVVRYRWNADHVPSPGEAHGPPRRITTDNPYEAPCARAGWELISTETHWIGTDRYELSRGTRRRLIIDASLPPLVELLETD
jgi:hypothetical protein